MYINAHEGLYQASYCKKLLFVLPPFGLNKTVLKLIQSENMDEKSCLLMLDVLGWTAGRRFIQYVSATLHHMVIHLPGVFKQIRH